MSVTIKIFVITALFWVIYAQLSQYDTQEDKSENNQKGICYFPGSNMNTQCKIDNNRFPVIVNTTTQYYCTYDGKSSLRMQMMNGQHRVCLSNGSWSGKAPICVHSLTEGFNNTVTFFHDNSTKNCTIPTIHECYFSSSTVMLKIYLFHPALVDVLDIVATQELDVEVENSGHARWNITYAEKNPKQIHTRIWYSVPLSVGSTIEIKVKCHTKKLTVIWDLNLFSQTGRSPFWCPKLSNITKVLPAGDICIHFAGNKWKGVSGKATEKVRHNFTEANEICKGLEINGTLIQPLTNDLQLLLENNVNYNDLFYWIGLQIFENSSYWEWTNGEQLNTSPFWVEGMTPHNISSNTCVALRRMEGFRWTERSCKHRNKWICQTGYVACGYPDRNPITLMNVTEYNNGFPTKVVYFCPEEFTLNGTEFRYCQPNGLWSDEAPFCLRSNTSLVLTTQIGINETMAVDSEMNNVNQRNNVYTTTAIGSVIAVVLVATGILLIWKRKKTTNQPDESKDMEEIHGVDSEAFESNEQLYDEIVQEKNVRLKVHDDPECSNRYETIYETPSNASSEVEDPNHSQDMLNEFPGVMRSLPLPTLQEEHNSHLEDHDNEEIAMYAYSKSEGIAKRNSIMVENDFYEGSDSSSSIENY